MRYLSNYIILLKRLLLLVAVYTILRLGFFIYNYSILFSNASIVDSLYSFLYGIVFDINAILYINLLFILLSLLPFEFINNKGYQLFLKIIYLIINIPFIFLNIGDFEYIRYTGKRTDKSFMGMFDDVVAQLGQMIINYWYFSIIALIIIIFLIKIFPKYKNGSTKLSWLKSIGLFLISLAITFIGLRGSFGLKPLSTLDAYRISNSTSVLTLNSTFSFIHSIGKKPLEKLSYFNEDELSNYLYSPISHNTYTQKNSNHDNVIILILESFSPEFTGFLGSEESFTPFLDSIAKEGYFFRYAFANGKTSMHGIFSILTGIPQLMDESIMTSIYQTNRFFSLPEILKNQGYTCCFFHGGKNGTMSFDRFASKFNLKYYGANEYNNWKDYDGKWGIYDDKYLKYCAKELNKLKKPFFASIFTLSSHQPYLIPEEYKNKFNRGIHPIQNAIEYADFSVKIFFNEISKYEWFKNTLFVFVADHTHPPIKDNKIHFIDNFHIPLILYHPTKKLNIDTSAIAQQVDIIPTLCYFLNIHSSNIPKFGKPLFFNDILKDYSDAITYLNGNYYLIKNGYYCKKSPYGFVFQDFNDNFREDTNKTNDVNRLKAIIQYFNNNMIDNTFVK